MPNTISSIHSQHSNYFVLTNFLLVTDTLSRSTNNSSWFHTSTRNANVYTSGSYTRSHISVCHAFLTIIHSRLIAIHWLASRYCSLDHPNLSLPRSPIYPYTYVAINQDTHLCNIGYVSQIPWCILSTSHTDPHVTSFMFTLFTIPSHCGITRHINTPNTFSEP